MPCMGIELLPVIKTPAATEFMAEMEGTLESARKNLEKAKEWIKLNANKNCLTAPDYTIGQQVWLATENLRLTCASQKTHRKVARPLYHHQLDRTQCHKTKTTEISADPPSC